MRVSHFVGYWIPASLFPPLRIVLLIVAAMVGVESGDLKRSPSYEEKYRSIFERSNSEGKVGEIESSLCCSERQLESARRRQQKIG